VTGPTTTSFKPGQPGDQKKNLGETPFPQPGVGAVQVPRGKGPRAWGPASFPGHFRLAGGRAPARLGKVWVEGATSGGTGTKGTGLHSALEGGHLFFAGSEREVFSPGGGTGGAKRSSFQRDGGGRPGGTVKVVGIAPSKRGTKPGAQTFPGGDPLPHIHLQPPGRGQRNTPAGDGVGLKKQKETRIQIKPSLDGGRGGGGGTGRDKKKKTLASPLQRDHTGEQAWTQRCKFQETRGGERVKGGLSSRGFRALGGGGQDSEKVGFWGTCRRPGGQGGLAQRFGSGKPFY